MPDIAYDSTHRPNAQRSQGIDALRALAVFLMVTAHCYPEVMRDCPLLSPYWGENIKWYVLIFIRSIVVPTFTLITGYYFYTFTSWRRILKAETRLITLYLIMVGLLAAFYIPLWSISEGKAPEFHRIFHDILLTPPYWYLRDMVIVIPLLYIVRRYLPGKWIYWTIIPLYLLNYWLGEFEAGPFSLSICTIPFLITGMWLHSHRQAIMKWCNTPTCITFLMIGLILLFAEVALYVSNGTVEQHLYTLTSTFAFIPLFILGIRPSIRFPKWMSHIGYRYSAMIYAVHMSIIAVLVYIFTKIFGYTHWSFFIINPIATFAISIIFIYLCRKASILKYKKQ